jgi:hypothetical protein
LICALAEGAGFEPAVHEVDAGFQDRWFQPLTHPSGKGNQRLAELVIFRQDWLEHYWNKSRTLLQRRRASDSHTDKCAAIVTSENEAVHVYENFTSPLLPIGLGQDLDHRVR